MSKENWGYALDDRSLEPYKVPSKKDTKQKSAENKSAAKNRKSGTGKRKGQ